MNVSDSAIPIALPFRAPLAVGRGAILRAVLLIAICALPLLLYVPFLSEPFERDEGAYATIAQGLLDGRVPYRDLFDHKPPLIYGWYAFSFLLFGEDVAAPRIVASLTLSVTTLLVFCQASLMFSRRTAYVAAAVFAISIGLASLQPNANTEVFMLMPLVASLAAFTQGVRSGRLGWFLLAGSLGGLAVMTKQVAMWNLAALGVFAAIWGWQSSRALSHRLGPLLSLVAGGGVVAALGLALFAAVGALDDFLYANVRYNWLYAGQLSIGEKLERLLDGLVFFSITAAPLVAGAAAGLFMLVRRRWTPTGLLLMLWVAGSVVGVVSSGRFYPHYFVHLLPAMALLTAVAIGRGGGSPPNVRRVPTVALVVGGLLVALAFFPNAAVYLEPTPADRHIAKYTEPQSEWENASPLLAGYIAARTEPGDTILNYGRETQLYFYADRRPAIRYIYDRPFWLDDGSLESAVAALSEAKPAYIIDSLQPPMWDDWAEYHPPEFMTFVSQNYDYAGRVYFADVYRLKERSD